MRTFRPSLLVLLGLVLCPPQLAAQTSARNLERPVVNPVVASPEFRRAVANETRTTRGVPGPNYWQQSSHYIISARLDVDEKRLHPKPWDFFNYFNTSTGQNLDWFWRTWFYETWTLDQTIESVTPGNNGTEIVVRDLGDAAMPTHLTITLANGDTLRREVPVTTWLNGKRNATVTVPPGHEVTRVEIEPLFPDVMTKNDSWDRQSDQLPADWPIIVRNDLVRRRASAIEDGFKPDGTLLGGSTANRASDAQTVTLEGGVEYSIIAVCGQECLDIDLEIKSAADSTLAQDASPNDWPTLTFTAPRTGEYDLTLIMYRCQAPTCAWGGQILRR